MTIPANPETRRTVDAGRYWAGVAATAVVVALVGLVGVALFEWIAHINVITRPSLTGSDLLNAVIGGIIVALVAGLVGFLLARTTPRPGMFFGWIMALLAIVALLAPFAWTRRLEVALPSGIVGLAIVVAAWSLVAVTIGRTTRLAPVPPPPGHVAPGSSAPGGY